MNRERDAGATGNGPHRGAWPDAQATTRIQRPNASAAPNTAVDASGWPTSDQDANAPAGSELTQPIPAVPGAPRPDAPDNERTQVIPPVGEKKKSLLKSSGSMAIATLISRITGFGWKLVLAKLVGFGIVNDSFNAANNLPNSLYELLLGGVLTSIVVPVLVRAQKSDPDGGQAYVQRLLTLSTVILTVGTVLSVIAAPLLTWIFITDSDTSSPALVTAFAYLLLPEIFFYGVSALLGAILQSKQIFGPPVWAPVVNNVVILATLTVYSFLPGELTLNPVRMSDAHVLTLGIGVTLGVVMQAAVQIPALRKTGFRLRWRWGWDSRLSEFGGLALWMVGYVAISMVGLAIFTRVGTAASSGSWSIYNYVWLLLQLPYGVIGFSVMTAILPRMSSAAADGDYRRLLDDLSLGNRLSTVLLLPISALMTGLGVPLSMALFSVKDKAGADATTLGFALAISAFGVLPYAITMMQMRTFNALKDARTPTLIMLIMTVVKIVLALGASALLPPEQVVYALTFVNSFTFIVGWLVGEMWLRHRLGPLGSRRLLVTLGKTLVASVVGGALAWLVSLGLDVLITGNAGTGTGWLQLIAGGGLGTAAIFGCMSLLRVAELQPAIGRLTGLLHRR